MATVTLKISDSPDDPTGNARLELEWDPPCDPAAGGMTPAQQLGLQITQLLMGNVVGAVLDQGKATVENTENAEKKGGSEI